MVALVICSHPDIRAFDMNSGSKLSREGMENLPANTRVKKEQVRQALTEALSGTLGSSLPKSALTRNSMKGSCLGCLEAVG